MLQPNNAITAEHLNARFGASGAETVLAVALDRYEGKVAMVSSFGVEAAAFCIFCLASIQLYPLSY